jgi:hypothetical protein
MADLIPFRRIHLVGVAGSGMSGLAKMFAQAGHPNGKPVQEIVDSPQPRVFEIGGAPWSDTLQILKRRCEDLVGGHDVNRGAR